MIRLELLFGLVTLCLFIYCLINVIQTPEESVRNLPKMAWLLIVLFLPFAGSVAWLVAGRPPGSARPALPRPNLPGFDRPGRTVASNPDDDEDFLRRVRERAEEQRRRAEEQRRRENGDPEPGAPADGG